MHEEKATLLDIRFVQHWHWNPSNSYRHGYKELLAHQTMLALALEMQTLLTTKAAVQLPELPTYLCYFLWLTHNLSMKTFSSYFLTPLNFIPTLTPGMDFFSKKIMLFRIERELFPIHAWKMWGGKVPCSKTLTSQIRN